MLVVHKLSHKLLWENIEWGIFINRYKLTIHVKELSILHVSLELYNVRPTHLLNTNLAQRYTRHDYTQKIHLDHETLNHKYEV